MKAYILILLLSLTSFGCTRNSVSSAKLSEVVPISAVKTQEIVINKNKFNSLVTLGDSINTIRVVEVFRRGENANANVPEYRLFDIQKGSAFDAIGLQNADVLQAANDYLIFNTDSFKVFVLQVMPSMKEASVNIARSGVPILLNYKFTE